MVCFSSSEKKNRWGLEVFKLIIKVYTSNECIYMKKLMLLKYIMILLLLHDLYCLIMSFLFQQVTSTLILVSLFEPCQPNQSYINLKHVMVIELSYKKRKEIKKLILMISMKMKSLLMMTCQRSTIEFHSQQAQEI